MKTYVQNTPHYCKTFFPMYFWKMVTLLNNDGFEIALFQLFFVSRYIFLHLLNTNSKDCLKIKQ